MDQFLHIAEYIDLLVNFKATPLARTHDALAFYGPARHAQGEKPLTYLAAQLLLDRVGENDYVLVLHNACADPWLPKGETDGPLGAASLARALVWGLGARPVFVAEAVNRPAIEASANAAGLLICPYEDVAEYRMGAAAEVVDFPLGAAPALAEACRLLDLYQPKAVVAVERIAPNELGLIHSGAGHPYDPATQAHVHVLVEEAQRRGIATIGIGDGGNEIGFGIIKDVVNAWKSEVLGGPSCQCGCGKGGATSATADVLVSASTSNWGAYGVAALLAIACKNRDVLQDEETEWRMLDACVRAGAADAGRAGPSLGVDGTSARASQAIIALLQEIVSNTLHPPRGRLFPPNTAELVRKRTSMAAPRG